MGLNAKLQVRRGGFEAVVELHADSGFLVLYGESGAGKSTALDALAGTIAGKANTSGRIVLNQRVLLDSQSGVCIAPHDRGMRRVYQDGRLFPHLSVHDNLRFARGSQSNWDEVVSTLELGSLLDRRPNDLSGGERQRVAIGRAVLANPQALLFDEPLSSLDWSRRRKILGYLNQLAAQLSVPMVYVTHSAEEMFTLARRAIRLHAGRVVCQGTPAEVLAWSHSHEFEDCLLQAKLVERRGRDCVLHLGQEKLFAADLDAAIGDTVYLRLSPRDIVLATAEPEHISARNCLPGRVVDMIDDDGTWKVRLELSDGSSLFTSVTKAAHDDLQLQPKGSILALFKSMALRQE